VPNWRRSVNDWKDKHSEGSQAGKLPIKLEKGNISKDGLKTSHRKHLKHGKKKKTGGALRREFINRGRTPRKIEDEGGIE